MADRALLSRHGLEIRRHRAHHYVQALGRSENREAFEAIFQAIAAEFGLTRDLGIETSFMAKRQLFRWPLGRFMREMGGVEVNREKGGNYVQSMIDEFNRRDDFLLTIAPEGTRKSVGQWKTGFYHIAVGAQVPLIVGMMDYAKKTGGLALAFMPTGDYAADMARVEEFYRSTTPKHPGKAMKSIMAASVQSAEPSTIDKAA